jgi:hypothetical protein
MELKVPAYPSQPVAERLAGTGPATIPASKHRPGPETFPVRPRPSSAWLACRTRREVETPASACRAARDPAGWRPA